MHVIVSMVERRSIARAGLYGREVGNGGSGGALHMA